MGSGRSRDRDHRERGWWVGAPLTFNTASFLLRSGVASWGWGREGVGARL
jgi:hypothetical protein